MQRTCQTFCIIPFSKGIKVKCPCHLWPEVSRTMIVLCVLGCSVLSHFCDPTDYSPPSSSVPGVWQAGILEWVAVSSSGASSRSRDGTCASWVSCICRGILYQCATGENGEHLIIVNQALSLWGHPGSHIRELAVK